MKLKEEQNGDKNDCIQNDTSSYDDCIDYVSSSFLGEVADN